MVSVKLPNYLVLEYRPKTQESEPKMADGTTKVDEPSRNGAYKGMAATPPPMSLKCA